MSPEFKKIMTQQQAAQNIFMLMRRNFDENIRTILSSVPYLDVTRAEDELILLDLFAVQYSLNITTNAKWHNNADVIFNTIKSMFIKWIGGIYIEKSIGSIKDAENIVNARLKSYTACVENADNNYENLRRLIGETYAFYAFMDNTIVNFDVLPNEHRYLNLRSLISPDIDDIAIKIGADFFGRRVLSLSDIFKENDVEQ